MHYNWPFDSEEWIAAICGTSITEFWNEIHVSVRYISFYF